MGKRKELKDGDVEMGGTRPEDDSGSDDVRRTAPPQLCA